MYVRTRLFSRKSILIQERALQNEDETADVYETKELLPYSRAFNSIMHKCTGSFSTNVSHF